MDRVAVFVDAGYLFAQGSIALSGQKLPRGSIALDHEGVATALESFATELARVPLLRIYWYDGTSTGPTSQHIAMAYLSNVKVRLGFVNSVGEQKGVDSLIVTDMIALARNRAMSDAVLLSGDEDLRVGVQQAQEFGVRVHLLGIKPSRGSQSLFLLQEADTTHEWGPDDLSRFLECRLPAPGTDSSQPPAGSRTELTKSTGDLRQIAESLARDVASEELESLVLSIRRTGQIPKDIDGRLLAKGRSRMDGNLDPTQKQEIRDAFLRACELRLTALSEADDEVPAAGSVGEPAP